MRPYNRRIDAAAVLARASTKVARLIVAIFITLIATNLSSIIKLQHNSTLVSDNSTITLLNGPTTAVLNQTYETTFAINNVPKNSYLEVYIYPHLSSRSEVQYFSTLFDGNLPLAVSNAIPITGSGKITIPLTLLSQAQASGVTQSGIAIPLPECSTNPCDGVYPIHFNIVTDGEVTTTIRIPVSITSGTTVPSLPLGTAINIDLTQLSNKDIATSLPEVVDELISLPQISATLTLTGQQLEGLTTSKSPILRNATKSLLSWNNNQNHEVHVDEQAPLDLASLANTSVDSLIATNFQLAKAAISSTSILPSKYLVTNYQLDQKSLDQISALGISNVIIPANYVNTPDLKYTITSPIDLETKGGGSVAAFLMDRQLGSDFIKTSNPYYNASLLTSDLTAIYEDQPNDPNQRVVVANLAIRGSTEVSTLIDFLGGLASTHLLKTESLTNATTLASSIAPETVGTFSRATPKSIGQIGQIQVAMRKIQSAASANLPDKVINNLLSNVLAATSPLNQGSQSSLLNENDQILTRIFSGITIPASKAVTISSRRSTVPISISAKGPSTNLKVKVSLISDRVRVDGGNSRLVRLTSSNDTISFTMNVNASGIFRATIAVTTPDGYIKLGQSNITFDYWAYGYIGTVVTIVFALLLIIWWIRTFSRGRPRNSNLLPKEKIAD